MHQVLFHVGSHARFDGLRQDQVHLAAQQVFEVEPGVHEGIEGDGTVEFHQDVHVAILTVLAARH